MNTAKFAFVWIAALSLGKCEGNVFTRQIATDQTPPSNNILDYISPSSISSASTAHSTCSYTITDNNSRLAYPNAKVVHQSSGTIDCTTQLILSGTPTGYHFSVSSVSVSGYLNLEPGAYVEKIEVSLGSPSASGKVGLISRDPLSVI